VDPARGCSGLGGLEGLSLAVAYVRRWSTATFSFGDSTLNFISDDFAQHFVDPVEWKRSSTQKAGAGMSITPWDLRLWCGEGRADLIQRGGAAPPPTRCDI